MTAVALSSIYSLIGVVVSTYTLFCDVCDCCIGVFLVASRVLILVAPASVP